MPTEREVLTGFLSKTLNMDDAGVAELYNSDGSELRPEALQELLDRDAHRVTSLKPDTKKIFDDGYKKGQSESLSKFEKELAGKYGITSDKKGLELIEDLVTKYQNQNPDDPEKIKKSKVFLDALEEVRNEEKGKYDKITGEFDSYKKQVEKNELFGTVGAEAMVLFENMKPILPQDAAKASNLKQVFLRELSGLNYTKRDGSIVLLEDDGSDMTDKHGVRIKFDAVVKQIAEKYFDFQVSDPKGAPPHGKGSQPPSVFVVTSEQDFINQMKSVKPEDKPKLLEAYNKWAESGK